MFLGKGVLKICSIFTREHPCRSVISIKLTSSLDIIKNKNLSFTFFTEVYIDQNNDQAKKPVNLTNYLKILIKIYYHEIFSASTLTVTFA